MAKKKAVPSPQQTSSFTEIFQSHHDSFRTSIKGETDRGTALVTAAFLEQCLETILRALFDANKRKKKSVEPLFEGFGPLSSFSGKISLSYSFSLISDAMEHDLHIIRKIRNEFAHSIVTKNFADSKIGQMVSSMKSCASYWKGPGAPNPDVFNEPGQLTRTKFAYASGKISAFLQVSIIIIASNEIPMNQKEDIFAKFGNDEE